MTDTTLPVPAGESAGTRVSRSPTLPGYTRHESFAAKDALRQYDPAPLLDAPTDFGDRHMPDEVTRQHARSMHYAAHRAHVARTPKERDRWHRHYIDLRDLIVLGNRKLIYRAVRRRLAAPNRIDDLIGDCHIVLIQAVAAYNPWMGIRFSTYAYTCLIRALSRLAQRQSTDWLSRSMSLEAFPDGEPWTRYQPEASGAGQFRVDEFLRDDHPLLSPREKAILARRFCLGDDPVDQTLEKVGKALGLSKERVRQVQATALGKLRLAMSTPATAEAV